VTLDELCFARLSLLRAVDGRRLSKGKRDSLFVLSWHCFEKKMAEESDFEKK
jgi:hypothetical protein